MTFMERLQARWNEGKSVCVGLDSELSKIPECMQVSDSENQGSFLGLCALSTMVGFNTSIVDATRDLVCAYKPNLAFYLGVGPRGYEALIETCVYIRESAPWVPIILDAKDMDIGNTNLGYVQMAFEYCNADAITVNPYLGMEAAQPFLDQKDKGVIVLCRTSNPGAGEFQDLHVSRISGRNMPQYEYVAYRVANCWNKNGNCAVVVGVTFPEELSQVRETVGDMPILIHGIGGQGGDLEAILKAGKNSRGQGMIISSSRGIIFASNGPDFAEAARRETLKLHSSINKYLNT